MTWSLSLDKIIQIILSTLAGYKLGCKACFLPFWTDILENSSYSQKIDGI